MNKTNTYLPDELVKEGWTEDCPNNIYNWTAERDVMDYLVNENMSLEEAEKEYMDLLKGPFVPNTFFRRLTYETCIHDVPLQSKCEGCEALIHKCLEYLNKLKDEIKKIELRKKNMELERERIEKYICDLNLTEKEIERVFKENHRNKKSVSIRYRIDESCANDVNFKPFLTMHILQDFRHIACAHLAKLSHLALEIKSQLKSGITIDKISEWEPFNYTWQKAYAEIRENKEKLINLEHEHQTIELLYFQCLKAELDMIATNIVHYLPESVFDR